MLTINKRSQNYLSFNFSSDMWIVDQVIHICKYHWKRFGVVLSFKFTTVLRELLINAVEHGNQYNFKRMITCEIEYFQVDQFKIMVQDQGHGFDPDSLDRYQGNLSTRKRGYTLIKTFTQDLQFNACGNQITAYIGAKDVKK